MREHLIFLSSIGIIFFYNFSIFLIPLIFISLYLELKSKINIFMLCFSILSILFFTFVSLLYIDNPFISLKSNIITFLPLFLIPITKEINFDYFEKLMPLYIIAYASYLMFEFYRYDFNLWELRFPEKFLIVGWPSNSGLFLIFGYLVLDDKKRFSGFNFLLKAFCVGLVFFTLNRAMIIGICIIVLFDYVRFLLSRKRNLLSLIPIGFAAYVFLAFLPADFLSILRIADTLNSFSNNASSLGFRLFVLWPSALNFISLNPIIGSGGLGISQVPEIIGGVADNTIESVYIDTIFRYGIFFGLLVLGMYLLILLSTFRYRFSNILIYPVVLAFLLVFGLNDAMRYPHIILLFVILYQYSRRKQIA